MSKFPLKRPVALIIFWGLSFLAGGVNPALADERLLSFISEVVVHPDASLTVTETIKVRVEGRTIKRGIVREFPTTYRDRFGTTVRVGFELLEVLRDQVSEVYRVESTLKGKKIYLGQKEVFLRPGIYTYTIRYRTDRQLGYFKDYDELYWNATGNDWTFPIDWAQCRVELPPGAQVLKTSAYTGPFGAKGRDYRETRDSRGRVVFTTTRPLGVREGLTVAVAWPKGLVAEPGPQQKFHWFFRDNLATVVALFGLVLTLAYFLVVWYRVGRDPKPGTIIPLFSPPKGFSPAGVRYLRRMGFDRKAFATAVVDLAVKGYLTIKEDDDGSYELRRRNPEAQGLDMGEWRLAHHLFDSQERISLKEENHLRINAARQALKESLDKELNQVYFTTNRSYFLVGAALSLLTLGAIILTTPTADVLLALFWLSIWSIGCCFLAVMVFQKWQSAFGGHRLKLGKTFGALALTLFALPFLVGEVFGLGYFTLKVSAPAAVTFAGLVLANGLFYHFLKAPTLAGRQIMDQVEGFRMYLAVAEQERLNLLNPPEKTPELFEKYLPYALALDVEVEWSEQFAEVLAQVQVEGQPYAPSWYQGTSWQRLGTAGFADSLGSSFASAIAASASAPGSVSGSSGGGFSGGGGGGGGGSGW